MVTKVLIHDEGDRSVGIEPACITIEANFDLGTDDSRERKEICEVLRGTFKELYDLMGNVGVIFSNECFDCNWRLKENERCSCEGEEK